jgi:hypothetical protein
MALLKFLKTKFRVEVDTKSLMLAPFLDIWNNDQTDTKDYANQILAFVHLVAQIDPDAPFYKSDKDEVRFLAKSQVFRNMSHEFTEEEEILIQNAIDVYIKANEVPEERMLRVFINKIDEMRLEIDRKKFEIVKNTNTATGVVSFASNAKTITDSMKSIDDILDVKEQLENRLKNAKSSDKRVKGQRDPSFLEKELMKSQSDEQIRKAARDEAASGGQTQQSNGGDDRPEQPEVSGDGTAPDRTKTSSVRGFLPAGKTNRRTQKEEPEAAGINEEF